MNTSIPFFLTALFAACLISCSHSPVYTVRISGEGADFFPDSSRVLVYSDGVDYRYDAPVGSACLDKGRFNISFQDSIVRVYTLLFENELKQGSFQAFDLFSDRTPLHFVFSRKYGIIRATVKGSPDNEEIYANKQKYFDTYEVIDSMQYELARQIASRYGENSFPEEGSREYADMVAAYDSINRMYQKITEESGYQAWQENRIRHHKSLAGLVKVKNRIENDIASICIDQKSAIDTAWLNLYQAYREIYPDSWLVGQTDKLLATLEGITPGKPYPDFSAPSLDGKRYRLSELIAGKIAVLDCWASWCRPCRQHSMELIPIYEKYRDQGFTVVGVAREYGSLDNMRHAIQTDGYPWIQLYDLDGTEGIWNLYCLSTGGGGIFLIGKDGKIVEKVFDINTIQDYLEKQLSL